MTKLLIATSCIDGYVTSAYAASVWAIAKDPNIELSDVWQWPSDNVRVRSRALHRFLQGNYSHLLFWDNDVVAKPEVIRGMLAANRSIVAAPYPYKRLHWERAGDAAFSEASAYDYPFHLSADAALDPACCCEVDAMPTGMMLVSRECAQAMTDAYRPSLEYLENDGSKAVALFQFLLRDGQLYSEDYSFCYRWRDLGGAIYAYVGPGTPCSHVGTHEFRGRREGLMRMSP